MKLGGILSEFPILDVSLAAFPAHPPLGQTAHIKSHMSRLTLNSLLKPNLLPLTLSPESPPLPLLPPQRSLRQEPLQARPRSA